MIKLMKNRIARFLKIDKTFLLRLVLIITIVVMLAAAISGIILSWSHLPPTASTSSLDTISRWQ